ncbi:MAG: hypothetical protein ACJ746_28775 [Bryobacteraceae bacterium]
MAEKIMMIRHGEKPDETKGIHGVDEKGKQDADELSVRGWQRAGALVRLFVPREGSVHPALAKPASLFAQRATAHVESLRSEHTLLPLARYLGKTIDTSFHRDDKTKIAKAAISATGVVLIAWEHDCIPDIGAAITGRSDSCPDHWPDDRFDVVWVLDRNGESEWKLTQVPQLVLAGDLSEVIAAKHRGQK